MGNIPSNRKKLILFQFIKQLIENYDLIAACLWYDTRTTNVQENVRVFYRKLTNLSESIRVQTRKHMHQSTIMYHSQYLSIN